MDFLLNGDDPGRTTILLAHGSGATMDTPWMNNVAENLAEEGFRVARFEFSYMAARRTGGSKRPPAKAETYAPEFLAAIEALPYDGPLVIGGKSMGGRVASLVARDLNNAGRIKGLLCLGFPNWTCTVSVPVCCSCYAAIFSNATGDFPSSAEWRLRGL